MHTPYALTAASSTSDARGRFNDRYRLFGFPQRLETSI
jgi:hypothetical protein